MNVFFIIVSLFPMSFGFITVFKALKSGEISSYGQFGGVHHYYKETDPFSFWYYVFIYAGLGFVGVGLFYKLGLNFPD